MRGFAALAVGVALIAGLIVPPQPASAQVPNGDPKKVLAMLSTPCLVAQAGSPTGAPDEPDTEATYAPPTPSPPPSASPTPVPPPIVPFGPGVLVPPPLHRRRRG